MKDKTLITLKNINKIYDKQVLTNINFSIKSGEKVAIVGANGGGKSTMSEILSGIRKPTSGQIIKNQNVVLGIQFQESKYPLGINILDMIKYYLETFNIAMTYNELNSLLKTYQLYDFRHKLIADLSIGDQQRLNILLAIIHKPNLIVLDEISTGLDIQVREDIFDFLEKHVMTKDVGIILITHVMNEVEKFCQRLVFLHQGKIIEEKTIKEVVKKFGSVQNYMQYMLNKHKSIDLEKKLKKTKKVKSNQMINKKKAKNQKGLALWELFAKYYLRGLFVPLFLFFYPILALSLTGFALKEISLTHLQSLVIGVTIVQIINIGIFILPETILDFKKSVLLKRIGATNIKPSFFVLSIASLGVLLTIFAYLWTLLWGGILFGGFFGWGQILKTNNILPSIPFLIVILATSTSFGMMLTAFFKTSSSFIAASNLLFVIIAFLSGGLIPMTLLEKSDVLRYVMYINPFHYAIWPYHHVLSGTFTFNPQSISFIFISLGLLSLYVFIGVKNLKWQT